MYLKTEYIEHLIWWDPAILYFKAPSDDIQFSESRLQNFVQNSVRLRLMHTRLKQRGKGSSIVSVPIVLKLDNTLTELTDTEVVWFGDVLDWPEHVHCAVISKSYVVIMAVFETLQVSFESANTAPNSQLTSAGGSTESFNAYAQAGHIVHSCQRGPRATMEDRYVIDTMQNLDCKLFAVFDGHSGERAAQVCADHFSSLLHLHLCESRNQYRASLMSAVAAVETMVLDVLLPAEMDVGESEEEVVKRLCGSCLCACVLTADTLYVANLGDSRAVLCRNGQARLLTPFDHNTDNPVEVNRVLEAGGRVDDGRINGYSSLNVTRSIGDLDYVVESGEFRKTVGVSAIPDVFEHQLDTENDEFVICACDGLWEAMTHQTACRVVRQSLKSKGDAQLAADQLVANAMSATTDNVTVLLALLPASGKLLKSMSSSVSLASMADDAEDMDSGRPRFSFKGLSKLCKV